MAHIDKPFSKCYGLNVIKYPVKSFKSSTLKDQANRAMRLTSCVLPCRLGITNVGGHKILIHFVNNAKVAYRPTLSLFPKNNQFVISIIYISD